MLIVDDEEAYIRALVRDLTPLGVSIVTTTDPTAVVAMVHERKPTVVLSDMRMPDLLGIDLLRQLRSLDSTISVVMMSGGANPTEVVTALKIGAYDYIEKAYADGESLRRLVQRALSAAEIQRSDNPIRSQNFLGNSESMQRVYKTVQTVSGTDATVLVVGESGTGKELIANAVHQSSARSKRPFIAVNCSALSETLLQSELFGHQRGAFTGADSLRKGLFEAANGGTIFLDEIGHISPAVQASLLRVLQEREVRRLGSSESVKVDVRVIAATNANLEQMVSEKLFRMDLYYRLNVVNIRLPALRERGDDILVLAEHWLQIYAKELGKQTKEFAPEALHELMTYSWPGNVRELQNVVYRAVLMNDDAMIPAAALRMAGRSKATMAEEYAQRDVPYAEIRKEMMDQFHRTYFEALLRRAEGNLSQASRLSGIDRTNLRRMLRENGIRA